MGDSEEIHIQHTFDSFCKKVVCNEALNIQKKYARFRQRQISMEILEQKGLGTEFYYLEPNLNSSGTFIVLGMKIFISNEELANAIAALPSQRQEIILCPSSSVLMIVKLAILLGKVSAVFGTNDKWLWKS